MKNIVFNALSVYFEVRKLRNFYPSLSLREYILSQIKILFSKKQSFWVKLQLDASFQVRTFPLFTYFPLLKKDYNVKIPFQKVQKSYDQKRISHRISITGFKSSKMKQVKAENQHFTESWTWPFSKPRLSGSQIVGNPDCR